MSKRQFGFKCRTVSPYGSKSLTPMIEVSCHFLPRDTMLARYMLSPCLSVRPSQAGTIRKRPNIGLVTRKWKPVEASNIISGQTLEKVDSAKPLDVGIDSKLTFNNHVDSICKRANSSHAFLSRNMKSCTNDSRDITYKTYVRPTVEYASTVWDPHTCRNTNKLEHVQRHAARYVTGNRD